MSSHTVNKHIVLVTGGNAGLGSEIVKALHSSTAPDSRPYHIIIGARSKANGEKLIHSLEKNQNELSTYEIDIESDNSIQSLVEYVKTTFGRLDTLVNNAGTNLDFQLQNHGISVREAWSKTWSVNVASTSIFTTAMVPLLLKSDNPRLLFITSGTSSLSNTERFDTIPFARINSSPAKGWPKPDVVNPVTIYRSSKTGMNMVVREWARILKEDGIKTFAVSPGFLVTGLGGHDSEKLASMGAIDPSIGGNFVKDVVEGKRDHDQGKAITKDGIQPW